MQARLIYVFDTNRIIPPREGEPEGTIDRTTTRRLQMELFEHYLRFRAISRQVVLPLIFTDFGGVFSS